MNNTQLKLRFQTRSRLGLIPDTSKVENRENELKEEYDKLIEIENSDEFKRFEDLRTFIESPDFKTRKKEINSQKYSDTNEYGKEQRYKELAASKEIKNYLKIKDSDKLASLNKIMTSGDLERFYELDKFFSSPEFKEFKRNLKKERKDIKFKDTDEYQQLQEYKQLKKSSEIKKARKFQNSKEYKLYIQTKDSDELQEYYGLHDYVNSEDFKEVKKQLTAKNKFKYSQEYQDLQKYTQLKNSDNIKWYFQRKDSKDFNFFRKWERTFFDSFDDERLDTSKWTTTPYWGKVLLKDSYVQTDDKHFFTNGKNLSIENSLLNIITKKEDVQGKAWHPKFGFFPKKFSYTSGIINTGENFRQKYGLFRAKVRIEHGYPFKHAFWLSTEKISPEVDVFAFMHKNSRKVTLVNYWGELTGKNTAKYDKSEIKGPDFSRDYFIFEVEWNENELIWRINGIPVKKQTDGVPDAPMYMIINSGLQADADERQLPSRMLVDWVEAYQQK